MIFLPPKLKLLILLLVTATSFSSCFISSRSNMDVFNKSEYAGSVSVKTIKMPMLISRPFLKKYLKKEEDVPKEVRDLISSLKKVRVTLAQTKNQHLINDFRKAVQEFKGEEWLTVQNNNKWIYLKGDQGNNDVIKRLMVAVSSPDDNKLIFVNMKCNLTMEQLSSLINIAMDSEEGKKVLKTELKKS